MDTSQNTFFNGAASIVQAGGVAALSPEGRRGTVNKLLLLENARIINEGLKSLGITTYGGGNAPYVWLKTPGGISSWDFFDKLLNECHVVGTRIWFGPAGEGFFVLVHLVIVKMLKKLFHRLRKSCRYNFTL